MRTLVIALLLVLALHLTASAQDGTKPRAEFTRIQDLMDGAKPTNAPVKQKWAVVVGISNYQDRRLNNTFANDKAARDFFSYLVDEKYGRFAKDHVKLLTNEEATRRGIANAIGDRWLGAVAGKDDLVVVFIATNGFPTTDGGTYLSAYDCALDNIYGTCISMKDLMTELKHTVKSDRVVLVLQAGHSGAADLNAGAKSLSKRYNLDPSQFMLGKGYVLLSSSQPDQPTLSSAFTKNLIAALKENGGLVPLQTAFAKAKAQTEYDTTYNQHPAKTQTPSIKTDFKGTDLVLGTPPIEAVANVPTDIGAFLGAESHYMRASKSAAAGDIDAAVSEYKLAIAADPKYSDAVADYGVALGLKNEWPSALLQLKRAVELSPRDVLFRTNLARALDQTGDRAECIKQLEYAYSLNPKDSTVLRALSGKAIASHDYDTARRLLSEAIQLYPTSAPLYDRLCYVDTLKGDMPAALASADKAIQLDPKLVSGHLNRGSVLLSMGQLTSAIDAYHQVLAIEPANADALYLLSQASERKGDVAGTKEALNRFLAACKNGDARADIVRKRLSDMTPAN